jgi:hypothetical protein
MKLTVLLFLVLMVGCRQQNDALKTYEHLQRPKVKKAIEEMLTQSTDPFLKVENAKTQKFIHFHNDEGRIVIDLPKIGMSPNEITLATMYFSRCGIKLKKATYTDPETGQEIVIKS